MSLNEKHDKAAKNIRRPGTERADGTLDTKELIRYATLAASSHNTQPWKFRIRQDTISILPDYSRRCPVVDPDDSHLFKSLGCATENLIHAAAAQGFFANAQFDPSEDGVIVTLRSDPSAHASDLYQAITQRQCTKISYDGSLVDEPELKLLQEAGTGEGIRTLLMLSEAQKETLIDYVSKGNTAQLTNKSFRDELVSWIRFNHGEALRTGDGLSGRTSGNPSLPSWLAKLIIGLVLTAKKQVDTDAINIRSSAGIAVFISTRNDKAAWVEAGRAYQRFALQATALNIRTAFINQPIEVLTLRPGFEKWLNLNGEHALLMVRFGHSQLAPFSQRRSIDDVIIKH
ncbi:Acg family FMN-binding oxidoreductase [Neptunomonas qingdaonensis]|uniref:Nitroreductase family protein n=1 Tax=Neptunomonas qingdaonensis TaxID=1045558 RepID=A0A1I2THT2_9GAMM|nr:nitroreductase family protein [Neptunomonas qingdaonensis]SFG61891.1 Nitroreductase family protein [Neptunomonas qingdaonensis]